MDNSSELGNPGSNPASMNKNKNGEADSPANNGKKRFQAVYRCIRALSPLPYLVKARDYYIKSMTQCAGRANYSYVAAGPYSGSDMYLPKSFSTNSTRERDEDEWRELIRAASGKGSSPSPAAGAGAESRALPRSVSTQVGRIDEDSPCYFPASFRKTVIVEPRDLPFPRSRSCN